MTSRWIVTISCTNFSSTATCCRTRTPRIPLRPSTINWTKWNATNLILDFIAKTWFTTQSWYGWITSSISLTNWFRTGMIFNARKWTLWPYTPFAPATVNLNKSFPLRTNKSLKKLTHRTRKQFTWLSLSWFSNAIVVWIWRLSVRLQANSWPDSYARITWCTAFAPKSPRRPMMRFYGFNWLLSNQLAFQVEFTHHALQH